LGRRRFQPTQCGFNPLPKTLKDKAPRIAR
jgi:hypothetical protein